MGSQTLDILRQGIWSSLTGGWYYDPHLNIFCNTFHLYLWLLLFCLPLVIYFYIFALYIWIGYVVVISVVIGIIKFMNLKLHRLFDTAECILEENPGNSMELTTRNRKRSPSKDGRRLPLEIDDGINSGGIILRNNIPSRNSVEEIIEAGNVTKSNLETQTDDIDKDNNVLEEEEEEESRENKENSTENKKTKIKFTNYKVDVHRKNSTSDENNDNESSEFSDVDHTNRNRNEADRTKYSNSNNEKIITPGTSEEFQSPFASNNSNMTSANTSVCHITGGASTGNITNPRNKSEQRSNSIDVFFASQPKSLDEDEYLKRIPTSKSTTSSAFELSAPPVNVFEQNKGLMFWNTNRHQRRKDQLSIYSNSGNINTKLKTFTREFSTFQNSAENKSDPLDGNEASSSNADIAVYPIDENKEQIGRFEVRLNDKEEEDDDETEEEEDESKSPLLSKKENVSDKVDSKSLSRQSSKSLSSHIVEFIDEVDSSKHSAASSSQHPLPSSSSHSITGSLSLCGDIEKQDKRKKSIDGYSRKSLPKEFDQINTVPSRIERQSSLEYGQSSKRRSNRRKPGIKETDIDSPTTSQSQNDTRRRSQIAPLDSSVDLTNFLNKNLSPSVGEEKVDSRLEYVDEKVKRSSSNLSKVSIKSVSGKSQDSEKDKACSSSYDLELDWLFEHTDSENENLKIEVCTEVEDENINYFKKDKSMSELGAGDSKAVNKQETAEANQLDEIKSRRDGDDDDEDDRKLVVKKKKRNRRERRHYLKRSLHAPQPSTSSGYTMSKKSTNTPSSLKKLEAYSMHDSYCKHQQQSEDDYDDDADDDIYEEKKVITNTEDSPTPNNIVYKELLQIFLATRNPKTDNEVFSFKNDEDGESLTSGLGSCMSTSPVPIHVPPPDLEICKIERNRNGRHSRISTRHHRRSKNFPSRQHRRNPLIRHPAPTQSPQQTNPSCSYQIALPTGTHLAVSHNDTTEGAVHMFRDENGEIMSYTFDEKGLGLAHSIQADSRGKTINVVINQPPETGHSSHIIDHSSLRTARYSTTSRDTLTSRLLPAVPSCSSAASVPIPQISQNEHGSYVLESLMPHSIVHRHMNMNAMNPNLRVLFSESSPNNIQENDLELVNAIQNRFHFIDSIETSAQVKQEPKRYYQFKLFPCFPKVKVPFNRLMLLSLLDDNYTLFYTILCLFLTVLVAVFGSWLLYLNFYKDIHVFIFCFVIAGCQYSMLKSVQPDASSPTHGFNKIIIFSRPVYFIVVSGIVLAFHYTERYKHNWQTFNIYTVQFNPGDFINASKEFLISFLLYFPLIFSFGLFPQVNTCFMYFLEQIDIYIFGGNATCSVSSALYCIFRSILSVFLLFGFAHAGLSEPKSSQHILFSIYCGLVVATSYHLSRCSSDPQPMWNIVKKYLCPMEDEELQLKLQEKKIKAEITRKTHRKERKTSSISRHEDSIKEERSPSESINKIDHELNDPLPRKLINTVNARLKSDLIICTLVCIFVFGIHCSTVFSALQPQLNPILWCITIALGILLHYLFPHLRKQLPWLCVARPVLKSNEYTQYEVRNQAKIMWFEKLYVYLCFFERNIVYPVLFIATITYDAPKIINKFGLLGGSIILTICALKSLRSSFSDPAHQYLILCFSILLFQYDFGNKVSETFLLDYCLTSILFCKCYEFLLKIQFVVTYIAPWQITWGSAFHAFAQPFSVPHSAMMFLQAFISAVLSSPLYPFLGSAIFLTSYPRPIKFWERDYNTRRSDHSNTRLVTQFDRTVGSDDNNLNSIFYEHLTRSLQHSLCGDLQLGRWGSVSQGDCFVLASDYLNCLIHIVEVGNGLVTFQMRGLEFRGTYCQQREVEAISESVAENEGCCCCEPGHLPHLLSLNAAFSQRWLAWEVTTTKYVLEGYSISDIPAASMLQVFDFRKYLISFYVRSIIYYVSNAAKLEEWLANPTIKTALKTTLGRRFVDLDPVFNTNIDEDYDFRSSGITRNSFCTNYLDWIKYCASRRKSLHIEKSKDSPFVSLCFALSLLGRRTLGAASHNTLSSVEFFLYGLHALFKGDFRITCERDEWVFTDMDLLKKVVAPAIKMSLKLHQDHFTSPDDYEDPSTLYNAITQHHEKLVISHEGDPTWRNAVLSGRQSLLALRHVLDDGVDEYKIIMLNKRYLSFRIIKMNRECVRGLWAGQQQELVYLRNKNPERGSIQNAKQALRNIINSSCDQPIGYPIFVSPLTTSYAETNEQLSSIVGGSLSLGVVKRAVMRFWRRIQRRCIEGCSSGGTVGHEDGGFGHDGVFMTTFNIHAGYPGTHSIESNIMSGGSMSRNRSSLPSIGKPSSSTLASLAGLLSSNPSESSTTKHTNPSTATIPSNCDNISESSRETKDLIIPERVRIVDPYQVHDALNLGRRIDVTWPDEKMRQKGGRTFWKDWLPEIGMEGQVVHKWVPNHRDPNKRSNVDRTILLIKIEDKYVPISENGVQSVPNNDAASTSGLTGSIDERENKP